MLSSVPSASQTISAGDPDKFAAYQQAQALKQEIRERNNEIERLERLSEKVKLKGLPRSNGVSSMKELESNTCLQSPTKTRAAPTGRLIESLQKEIDSLRLASESDRLQAEVDRRTRETLLSKLESIEQTVQTLKLESANMQSTILRRDRTIADLQLSSKDLESRLLVKEEHCSKALKDKDALYTLLCELRGELEAERETGHRFEAQYNLISREFQNFSVVSRQKVSDLSQEIKKLRTQAEQGLTQLSRTHDSVINLNHSLDKELRELQNKNKVLEEARKTHAIQMQIDLKQLKDDALTVQETLEHDTNLISKLDKDITRITNKCRAVDHEPIIDDS